MSSIFCGARSTRLPSLDYLHSLVILRSWYCEHRFAHLQKILEVGLSHTATHGIKFFELQGLKFLPFTKNTRGRQGNLASPLRSWSGHSLSDRGPNKKGMTRKKKTLSTLPTRKSRLLRGLKLQHGSDWWSSMQHVRTVFVLASPLLH